MQTYRTFYLADRPRGLGRYCSHKLRTWSMLPSMDSLPAVASPTWLPHLPSWTRPRTHDITESDAAFAAGIALKCLDDLILADPPWLGCWRDRLALRSAAAASRSRDGRGVQAEYQTGKSQDTGCLQRSRSALVQQLSDADGFEFQDRLALAALIANKRRYSTIRGNCRLSKKLSWIQPVDHLMDGGRKFDPVHDLRRHDFPQNPTGPSRSTGPSRD